jgi:hypothetical protein
MTPQQRIIQSIMSAVLRLRNPEINYPGGTKENSEGQRGGKRGTQSQGEIVDPKEKLIPHSDDLFLFYLLAYINCTKGFHCNISIHAYNVL